MKRRLGFRASILGGVLLILVVLAAATFRRGLRSSAASAPVASPAPASAATPGSQATRGSAPRCERCHGELEFLRQQTPSLSRAQALLAPYAVVHASVHGKLSCTECHRGYGGFPHRKEGAGVQTRGCVSCHEKQAAAWKDGVHAGHDGKAPVACQQCHGVHDVRPAAELASGAPMRAMNERCLACHDAARMALGTAHADSVSCTGCHGAHAIQPPDAASSRLAATRQVETCGTCHDTIAGAWRHDVHGTAVLAGGSARAHRSGPIPTPGEEPPTCTTCHGTHAMLRAGGDAFALAATRKCTECHERYADTFGDSYHGQATELGSPVAATCADCHGAHDILPASDPRSKVAKANLVATCGQCHKEASASFVEFQPHADPHDAAKNPILYWVYRFMTLLLIGVLSVFGLHTLLWLSRVAVGGVMRRRGAGSRHGGEQ